VALNTINQTDIMRIIISLSPFGQTIEQKSKGRKLLLNSSGVQQIMGSNLSLAVQKKNSAKTVFTLTLCQIELIIYKTEFYTSHIWYS
jgi:hypothetical protein